MYINMQVNSANPDSFKDQENYHLRTRKKNWMWNWQQVSKVIFDAAWCKIVSFLFQGNNFLSEIL